ncbi:MAG: type I-U CRISPR-associated helicase/endonuclease Cas3, partial [Rhodospirillales bacterium]|nr:type I-U CRISPR-associated helicase/endonuclease Cas3 [Rhodospirillales bacterium]
MRQGGDLEAPLPPFEAFYRALNRREPLPWQARLAKVVAESEAWPAEIGVPTGLGKTACLDIAIWWLASQAHRDPGRRTAPTRIWWVVNRRLLVDAVTDHAEFIGRALAEPASEGITGDSARAVSSVGDRLLRLAADPKGSNPLEVIRLRGGVASGRPVDPSRPAVLLSTLPMYGSRLLFRGFGTTRSMRPVDAALAGTDSLVMLDEAHLVPHLRTLIADLRECTPGAGPVLPQRRSSPRLVALTATGDVRGGNRFELDADDKLHPVVRQRLDAAKPVELRVVRPGDAGPPLATAALDLLGRAGRPSACVVFANTPRTARSAFAHLGARMTDDQAQILLLTGIVREHDAEGIRERVVDPVHGMAANRLTPERRQRHLIVVATQTLEVGADIDAEYLVTEACGVRALTQRLGRLNRLGRFRHARGIYVHCPPRPDRGSQSWPVYGPEPVSVLARLQAAGNGSPVDLPPRRVAGVLGAPGDDPGRAPQILPGILREWTKTTTPPDGEAPVEPYFSGIAGAEHRVSLLWRCHVPGDGEWLWPRPAEREVIAVPRRDFRTALGEDERVHRIDPDGVTIREVAVSAVRAGDTVVLASDRGLMDGYGWNPESSQPVMDLSL